MYLLFHLYYLLLNKRKFSESHSRFDLMYVESQSEFRMLCSD
jgi:hypothetical protein